MSSDDDGPRTATGCAPCNANVRNNYFRGKMMTVADYQAEQRYMIERRRAMNRLLLGWGIISGFDVELRQGGGIAVSAGSALDPCGREVIACHDVVIKEEDDVIWLKEGKCGLEPTDPPKVPPAEPPAPAGAAGYGSEGDGTEGQPAGQEEYRDEPGPAEPPSGPAAEQGELCYLLSAHYAERHVDGVRVSDGCDDSACATNRICETVVYSLRPPGKGSPLPATGDCEDLAPAEGQVPAQPPSEQPQVGAVDNRGQAGLCLHDPEAWCDRAFDPCCIPQLKRAGDLHLDCDSGIALAYVCFTRGRCGELVFTGIHAIIRGCELTRIKDIGWPNWHNDPDIVIGRTPFFAMFVEPAPVPNSGDQEAEATRPAVDTHFWVCFTAPVQIASLTRDVVSISLIQPDSREAVGNVVRAPIEGIWYQPTLAFDPPGTTRGFRPFVSYQFWQGEIDRGSRSGFANETLVELRIRGNSIIDWAGRPVDADSIAHRLPSGNGTPGGEFLSCWRVRPNGDPTPARGPAAP